jgi:hypothetical protein
MRTPHSLQKLIAKLKQPKNPVEPLLQVKTKGIETSRRNTCHLLHPNEKLGLVERIDRRWMLLLVG